MVKNIISTAFVMLSLSSVANAEALFSADKTLGSSEKLAEAPDWLEGTHTKDMTIKTLGSNNEYGIWRNNIVPLEQTQDKDMATNKVLDGKDDNLQLRRR